MYQPQIASWENQKQLVAFAALSHVAKGEQKPALGTIKFETETEVSLEQRLVKFSKIKIVETNFQTLSKEQTQEIVNELEKTYLRKTASSRSIACLPTLIKARSIRRTSLA